MELVVEPDIYSPSIDDKGNYIDRIPSFNIIKKGLLCPCGARKDKIYESHTVFASHIKTKVHQSWLVTLNFNKTNYFSKTLKLLHSKEFPPRILFLQSLKCHYNS